MDPTLIILLTLIRRGSAGATLAEIADEIQFHLRDIAPSIETLREQGCIITESGGRFVLEQTSLNFWSDIIQLDAQMSGRSNLGMHAVVYSATASTNDLCWQLVGMPDKPAGQRGLVVLADHQTAGRGRRGNQWLAAPGQSVLMSVVLEREDSIENITLLAGLAAAEGIEAALEKKIRTEIKWPNDVHIDGKKVAGVLVEGRAMGRTNTVVIGIGVNVAQTAEDFPEDLRERATSCRLALGSAPDRIRIITDILSALEARTSNLADNSWMTFWKNRCKMFGRRYMFESGGKKLEAEIIDIDLERGLIVRDAAGAMHFLHSATTTIIPQ